MKTFITLMKFITLIAVMLINTAYGQMVSQPYWKVKENLIKNHYSAIDEDNTDDGNLYLSAMSKYGDLWIFYFNRDNICYGVTLSPKDWASDQVFMDGFNDSDRDPDFKVKKLEYNKWLINDWLVCKRVYIDGVKWGTGYSYQYWDIKNEK